MKRGWGAHNTPAPSGSSVFPSAGVNDYASVYAFRILCQAARLFFTQSSKARSRTMTTASSPKTVSKETYNQHIQRASNTSNYFMFFRGFFKIVKRRLDALFLQDVINLASLKSTVTKDIGEETYFLCTESYLIESDSEWSRDEQKRHFHALAEKGFVRLKKLGMPPRRWVYIDHKAIGDALDRVDCQSAQKCAQRSAQKCAQQRAQEPATKKEETTSLLKDQKKHVPLAGDPSVSSQDKNGYTPRHTLNGTPAEEEPFTLRLARKLFKASLAKEFVDPKRSNVLKWERLLRPLLDSYPADEVERVLDWHLDPSRFGQEYFHKAYCAKEFAAKFLKIRAKMLESDPLVTITRVVRVPTGGKTFTMKSEKKQVRESDLGKYRDWRVVED